MKPWINNNDQVHRQIELLIQEGLITCGKLEHCQVEVREFYIFVNTLYNLNLRTVSNCVK